MSPPGPTDLASILRAARRIGVVGLSPRPERPSHTVAAYLQRAGYTIVPIHPSGGVTLGEPVHPDLRSAAAGGPLDIVNVFRRSGAVPDMEDDLLAVRPGLVWLQLGVTAPELAQRLEAKGIPVVMDRCLAVDHQALVGTPPPR